MPVLLDENLPNLDENLPKKLAFLFPAEVEAVTVAQRGWKGVKNGELLALAQSEFYVFVTIDGGSGKSLAV